MVSDAAKPEAGRESSRSESRSASQNAEIESSAKLGKARTSSVLPSNFFDSQEAKRPKTGENLFNFQVITRTLLVCCWNCAKRELNTFLNKSLTVAFIVVTLVNFKMLILFRIFTVYSFFY